MSGVKRIWSIDCVASPDFRRVPEAPAKCPPRHRDQGSIPTVADEEKLSNPVVTVSTQCAPGPNIEAWAVGPGATRKTNAVSPAIRSFMATSLFVRHHRGKSTTARSQALRRRVKSAMITMTNHTQQDGSGV